MKKLNKFFNCLYCNDKIKAHLLSDTKSYYFCANCACQYIQKDEIIIRIDLDITYNNKGCRVELDLIKNETILYVNSSKVYSYNECLPISPQNIKKKVQMWLLIS